MSREFYLKLVDYHQEHTNVSSYSVSGNALECYVCENQEGNREKCLNTISTCEYGQDTCLTEVKWGSMYLFYVQHNTL